MAFFLAHGNVIYNGQIVAPGRVLAEFSPPLSTPALAQLAASLHAQFRPATLGTQWQSITRPRGNPEPVVAVLDSGIPGSGVTDMNACSAPSSFTLNLGAGPFTCPTCGAPRPAFGVVTIQMEGFKWQFAFNAGSDTPDSLATAAAQTITAAGHAGRSNRPATSRPARAPPGPRERFRGRAPAGTRPWNAPPRKSREGGYARSAPQKKNAISACAVSAASEP